MTSLEACIYPFNSAGYYSFVHSVDAFQPVQPLLEPCACMELFILHPAEVSFTNLQPLVYISSSSAKAASHILCSASFAFAYSTRHVVKRPKREK